jgi:uncharacterized damage-inducible protein DinB
MPAQAPALTDERALLLAYIAQQRDGIRNAAFGLTDDQARQTPTVSSLSIGGLVKHVARTEQSWTDMVRNAPRAAEPSGEAAESDGQAAYADGFRLLPGETLADVLAAYEQVGRETEEVIAAVPDLSQEVPVPKGVPWFPDDVEAWSVRWVLLHIVEETARHAGHADIIREAIDGATMYPLLAAAEGWPATDWLQPWTPGE